MNACPSPSVRPGPRGCNTGCPVAVEYQTGWWPATPPRHGQRVLDQAGLHVRLQAPAHHLAAKQVDDGGQVQPAFVGLDVGDVATPELVGSFRVEAPLHQVRCHRQAVAAVGGDHELALRFGLDAMLLHELANPVFAHPDASGHKLLVHAWPAVFALDLGVDGTDVRQQGFIAVESARAAAAMTILSPAQSVEVPAGADLQHPAGHAHRVTVLHLVNPGVPRSVSCAKYAAAFFAMSRSMRRRAFSARSRAISICSGETLVALSALPTSSSSSLG